MAFTSEQLTRADGPLEAGPYDQWPYIINWPEVLAEQSPPITVIRETVFTHRMASLTYRWDQYTAFQWTADCDRHFPHITMANFGNLGSLFDRFRANAGNSWNPRAARAAFEGLLVDFYNIGSQPRDLRINGIRLLGKEEEPVIALTVEEADLASETDKYMERLKAFARQYSGYETANNLAQDLARMSRLSHISLAKFRPGLPRTEQMRVLNDVVKNSGIPEVAHVKPAYISGLAIIRI